MDLRELKYFVKVVEEGSITRAAESIGISQPALSKRLRLLEERLEVKLLERTSTGMATTTYGEALYVRAKSIIAEMIRAETELQNLRGLNSGSVTVGVLPTQAMTILPQTAVRLLKSRPGLHIRVIEKPREELHAGLRRGEFDFILSAIDQRAEEPGIVRKVLYHDQPSVIVRARHPLTHLAQVTSEELLRYPWVVPLLGTLRRRYVDEFLDSMKLSAPADAIEGQSVSFLKAVVMQSDYVGFLPCDITVLDDSDGKRIAALELKAKPRISAIGVVYKADHRLSDAALATIRELQNVCKQFGYR